MSRGRSRRLPKGCYWRGGVIWFRATVVGVEHRTSLRTDNVEAAERKAEAIRNRLMADAYGGEHRRSYDEAFVAWADHAQREVAISTLKRYVVSLGQMEAILRPLMVDEIDDAVIRQIITRRRQSGITNATIRRDLVALSSLLGYAEDEGWRKGNPALDRMKRIGERRDPIVLPDDTSIARVIARAPGNLSHLILFALQTGARQDEVVTARWSDINMTAGTMRIVGKGNKLRTIELSPGALDTLRTVPRRLRCPWVFWHGEGTPYASVASRFVAIVGSARKAAQSDGAHFRPFRFHDLRHRFAVDWLRSGRAIYGLQQHLGHGSVKTTEIYLAHLTADEQAVARGDAQNQAHREVVSGVPSSAE
jgi:integrase/recombinase XerD